MSETSKNKELKQLEGRIDALMKTQEPKPAADEHFSMANMAWRMVIELVAGLGIGFGIGYGLDRLFGTLPLFLVIFVGLGFAAGVRVMMRTAQEVQDKQVAEEAAKTDKEG